MASKLIRVASYEADNQQVLSLRQAFEILEPRLRPPFPLTISDPQEYLQLNRAIVYGVLCEPNFAKIHVKHLHAIVTDGYSLFSSLLAGIVNELYEKLVDSAKNQLIWVTREMIDVSAIGIEGLLVSLLRRIVGGDFGDRNLWLCFELVSLFLGKWDCLLEEEPLVMTSASYTFLRLLADHCRVVNNLKLENVRKLEMEFCVKMLREQFHLCLKIGRDLVRLLQDLVHVPEFKAIWKDLVLNPGAFKTPGFSDISQIYRSKTSSSYFLLRITPEMGTQLHFLLTHVKLGSQKRHQIWFAKKFLLEPPKETLLIDIVRFICCAHHPSNEILQSEIIPRWAVIGWLLKLCRTNYIECNVKLALFYDWLFFDERIDNIMNIEPAMLLMVCSIPQYIDITNSLLEFLFLLVDNYDTERCDIITRGVSSAFGQIVRKEVVSSLDVLTSCPALAPFLKEKLEKLLSCPTKSLSEDLEPDHLPGNSPEKHHFSCAEENGYSTKEVDIIFSASNNSRLSHCSSRITNKSQFEVFESSIQSLGETLKQSGKLGFQTLEEILLSFIHLDNQREPGDLVSLEVLSSKIAKEFEMAGYRLFAPLQLHTDASDCDDEFESATALIIRTFIYHQKDRMMQLLLFWLRNGFLVGARLLSYAARLADEACLAGCLGTSMGESKPVKISDSASRFLRFHIDGYLSFTGQKKGRLSERISFASEMENMSVATLVENAFSAYACFLKYTRTVLHKETDKSLSKLLFPDLISCCAWGGKSVKYLFSGIFAYLSDLSIGEENIIRLLVGQVDHADLVNMLFDVRLKKISLFGEDADVILNLIKKSLSWDSVEQHKFWGLIRSELAVSGVQVEKIILEFFCCDELEANIAAIAIEGLLAILSSVTPTLELVGAIALLPNNILQDFAPAVLSTWAVSNPSMLFESFAKVLEKLEKKNKGLVFSDSSGIVMNHSAICWLLEYFNSKGIDVSDVLMCFSGNAGG